MLPLLLLEALGCPRGDHLAFLPTFFSLKLETLTRQDLGTVDGSYRPRVSRLSFSLLGTNQWEKEKELKSEERFWKRCSTRYSTELLKLFCMALIFGSPVSLGPI